MAAVVGAVVLALTGPLGLSVLLKLVGFSSIGPVLGSLAAAWQSSGVGLSVFSLLQSLAMGGAGATSYALFATTGAAAFAKFCAEVEALGLCEPSKVVDLEKVMALLLSVYEKFLAKL